MFKIDFFKEKYIMIFLKNTNGIYADIKRLKTNPLKTVITFNTRTYPIDFNKIVYRNGLRNYLMIDADNGEQLSFADLKTVESNAKNELMDLILSKGIITQLISRLGGSKNNIPILLMILALIIGLGCGYAVGNIYTFEEVTNFFKNIKLW